MYLISLTSINNFSEIIFSCTNNFLYESEKQLRLSWEKSMFREFPVLKVHSERWAFYFGGGVKASMFL